MGCRLPGGANSPGQLWQMLLDGTDAVSEVPLSRFEIDRFYHPKPATAGHIGSRMGAFVDTIDAFDAAFFGISPREAERLDPQQRLLLEVAWETFEDAGVRPEVASLRERTGVFIGMMESGYENRLFQNLDALDVLGLNGAGRYGAAGRLSYCFRLSGPSMVVDTACSSSLVAVHLACQSLRAGEASLALAGGTHLILQPQVSISFSQGEMLAPDGRCKFGDASANGFGRGEGVGLVLLEPLEQAIANGHKIYAVIRGSAVGSYGLSDGAMPRPSTEAQSANLRAAYDDAGVEPSEVQYVEAHGTGTRAGDGTEMRALAAVLGEGRAKDRPFAVGSVKTNLAHAEAASGIAGLIKVALSLHHRYIPKSLHFHTPSPRIPWNELPLFVQREAGAWPEPAPGGRRIAGINNFGISGTNAHLVLEEAPFEPIASKAGADGPALLPISARSREALVELTRAYHRLLSASGEEGTDRGSASEIVRAAAIGRSHCDHRLSVVAPSSEGFAAGLEAFLRGVTHPGVSAGQNPRGEANGRLAFVFSGHGSQWLGMGRQLMASAPPFAAALDACDAALRTHTGFSLIDELRADANRSRLDENQVVQPVLFGVAVALAALWRAWGIEPDAVVGHSMGEIAATHVAGVLSLDEAARIVCFRSQLLNRVTGLGGMVMVELSEREACEVVAAREELAIAVVQSERACVLSGTRASLEDVVKYLEKQGVFCRWVKVDYASHSPQMECLREDLLRLLRGVAPRAGSCPIYSTLLGRRIDGAECDALYWYENLRRPVRFADAVAQLVADGHRHFVEISPHPLLLPAVSPAVRGGVVVPSLRRDEDEHATLFESLGALYTAGRDVAFEQLHPPRDSREHWPRLPAYPFQRKRYWCAAAPQKAARVGHPLIGTAIPSSLDPRVTLFDTTLGASELPYLRDHAVDGAVVMPGVAFVEMALAAGQELAGGATLAIEDLAFEAALVFSGEEARSVQLANTQEGEGRFGFSISSRGNGEPWLCHVHGKLVLVPASTAMFEDILEAASTRACETVDPESFYSVLAARGLEYGPAFRGVTQLSRGEREAIARVKLPDGWSRDVGYTLHPALVDACLHPLLALMPENEGGPMVPAGVGEFRAHAPLREEAWSHAVLTRLEQGRLVGDVRVLDDSGAIVLELLGVTLVQLERRRLRQELLFAVEPSRISGGIAGTLGATDSRPAAGPWLIVGDAGGHGEALCRALEAKGERVVFASGHRGAASLDYYARLLATALPESGSCGGVVHLASMDQGSDPTLPELIQELEHGTGSVLHLVQALAGANLREQPRLYLVTRGAHALGSGEGGHTSPSGATLLGLGRVLAYEHPELRVTRIDVSPSGFAGETDALASILLGNCIEDELMIRPDGAFRAQLVRGCLPARTSRAPTVRPDRTYLITGGLGALGRTLTTWLIEQGARSICLVGRTDNRSQVDAWCTEGVSVTFAQADVSDRERLASVIAGLELPLAGVFHTAGILDDGLAVNQSVERLCAVMAPKVLGAWNLHQLTRSCPIEHFVLYSSATSLLGTPGQSGYAAANAFLDALAHYRRALDLPALSVNWGAFSDIGLAASQDNRGERLRFRGLGSLAPAEGTDLLGELLQASVPPHVGLMRFDARQWLEFHPQLAGSTFFAPLFEDGAEHRPRSSGTVVEQLGRLAGQRKEQRGFLERFVAESAAQVLRLEPSKIDHRLPFRSAGFDSLMGLELRNRLESALGLRLPATLLWVHPSVADLTEHLLSQLFGEVDQRAGSDMGSHETASEKALEEKLVSMSEEDKEELLARTLQELSLEE